MEESILCKSSVASSTGNFIFEVDGYSALPDEVGDTVESPEFELCQRTWQLRIFPGGSLQAHKGYLSFYLASKSTVISRASYKLIIVRQPVNSEDEYRNQPLTDEVFSSTGIRKFEARGVHVDGWGRDKFISTQRLKDSSNGLLVNNKVIFKTEITVFGELESPLNTKLIISQKKDITLKFDISKLLFDKKTSDLELIIGGDEGGQKDILLAHKSILCARSPVFYAMLQDRENNQKMSELSEMSIKIPDIDLQTMKELLKYIYTEECSLSTLKNNADKLLQVASKYQVIGLLNVTEEFLSTALGIQNAADMLQLADMYHAKNLRSYVLNFISGHSKEIVVSEGFANIRSELQEEILLITEKSIKKCCKRRSSVDGDNWKKIMSCVIV